jgi:hypothetical protein
MLIARLLGPYLGAAIAIMDAAITLPDAMLMSQWVQNSVSKFVRVIGVSSFGLAAVWTALDARTTRTADIEFDVQRRSGERSKSCPNRKLINVGSAERCDCGYVFFGTELNQSFKQ